MNKLDSMLYRNFEHKFTLLGNWGSLIGVFSSLDLDVKRFSLNDFNYFPR